MVHPVTLWKRRLKAEHPETFEAKYAAPGRRKAAEMVMNSPELLEKSLAYKARRAKSAEQRREEKAIRGRKWRIANPEKLKGYCKKFRDGSPRYQKVVAKIILSQTTGLPIREISDALADAKVAQLRVSREVRIRKHADPVFALLCNREKYREQREKRKANPALQEAHRKYQREWARRKYGRATS